MDKKALLDELRIDRAAAVKQRRPAMWFVALAVLAGVAFVAWAFGWPLLTAATATDVRLQTALVRASADASVGDSVLDATGYVVARRQATVSSKTTGKVLDVYIEEGMTVDEGQLLAVLDDSIPRARLGLAEAQLEAARAALQETRVDIRKAGLAVERTRSLAERDMVGQADLDRDRLNVEGLQARLARLAQNVVVAERSLALQRRELEDMRIRAPFGGVVIAKAAQPGEMISPVSAGGGFTRTGICTIVDMDSLEVEVDVNEAYINRVEPEQPATVTLNAYPDFRIRAKVIATIPAADRNKATVRVRIAFLQKDARILPDMGAKVAFLDRRELAQRPVAAEPVVWLPRAALREQDGSRYVWVVADGTVERRAVQIGARQADRFRVLDGLAGGERVVVGLNETAFAGLRDGAKVDGATVTEGGADGVDYRGI